MRSDDPALSRAYTVDFDPGTRHWQRQHGIVVVGCGGTGGFVAEGLCRLFADDPKQDILLIDFDRVEPHNLLRQNFYEEDIGRYKSQVLAERLSRLYQRPIAYAVTPFTRAAGMQGNYGWGDQPAGDPALYIGCVDNAQARKALHGAVQHGGGIRWYIDAGNSDTWGQVLIGNMPRHGRFFYPDRGTVAHLPAPAVQQPNLLLTQAEEPKPLNCAQAVQAGDQSPTINQAMATVVLEVTRKLLVTHTLSWMAVYLSLEEGTMRPVLATPRNAAHAWGVRPGSLVAKPPKGEKEGPNGQRGKYRCPNCGEHHLDEPAGDDEGED